MHPRDTRTIFSDKGLNVSDVSFVPWEVIQLNHDFSGHVFISLSSGSIVNTMAMTKEAIPSYFLYPMVMGKNGWMDSYAENINSTLERLQAMGVCKSVRSINSLQEITD